jgi:hypothetical protein
MRRFTCLTSVPRIVAIETKIPLKQYEISNGGTTKCSVVCGVNFISLDDGERIAM